MIHMAVDLRFSNLNNLLHRSKKPPVISLKQDRRYSDPKARNG